MLFHQVSPEEGGQSLVEYALILALVALVIIATVALFGTALKDTYCRIVYQVAPGSDISSACSRPIVMPKLVAEGPNFINVEVQVHDPDGDPGDPYAAITQVEFYIDDMGSGPVHTEFQYRYCLGSNSGTNPCQNYNTGSLSNGEHTITILAYDADGNVGRGTYKFVK
jgi:Flp pilus assembly pilin Flp